MDFSQKILNFFTTVLCPTPRASRREGLIADRLAGFAAGLGLTSFRDDRNNVVVYKPGAGKYAGASVPVILQAHTDMVCVPATADFSAGVEAYYSSDNRLTGRSAVTKEKTSLGADDGIGVAAIMAVLDGGGGIAHPPLVAIFTAEEECGLIGARDISADAVVNIAPGLDFSRAAFINLDNGRFGEFSVGCAGSADVTVRLPAERAGVLPPGAFSCFELAVCGLAGGHSGLSIHEGRGNANIILCEAVDRVCRADAGLRLFGFGRCGDAPNAIPAEALAYFAVPKGRAERFREAAAEADSWFKGALRLSGGAARVEARESGEAKARAEAAGGAAPYTADTVSSLTGLATRVKDGPIAFCAAMPQLVETSSNLGIIKDEGGHITLTYMVRSSVSAEMERAIGEIRRHAGDNHAEVEVGGRSPGWAYKEKCALRDLFLNKYKELFGEEAAAIPVHAGLECGHFAEKFSRFKGMGFISCGPTSTDIHSVNETLRTDTVEKFGRLLIEVLGSLYS